jgi:hypothetical protein
VFTSLACGLFTYLWKPVDGSTAHSYVGTIMLAITRVGHQIDGLFLKKKKNLLE